MSLAKPVTNASVMMMIGIFWLAIIFSLSAAGQEIDSVGGKGGNSSSSTGDDKLQVTIYYEALCYDSISFITNQLAPSWERRRSQMDLKLVPFGKAYIDDRNPSSPIYYCQHGHRECTLNILHGCILDKLTLEKAFPVVACLMKGFRTSFDACIGENQEVKEEIEECAVGSRGATLFKQFSEETNRVATPLPFVPSIQIDEVYDYFDQDRWLNRFERSFREDYRKKFSKSLE